MTGRIYTLVTLRGQRVNFSLGVMVFYFCFVIVVGVFSLKSFNCRGGGGGAGASKLSHDFRAAEESKRKKAWYNCFSFFGH